MKKKKTPGQIGALAAVALICVLIIALLWAALFGSTRLFQALLVCAIGVPLLIWIYVWLYGVLRKKHTIASLDVEQGIAETLQQTEAADPSGDGRTEVPKHQDGRQ